jgi:hypothetical protein
MGSFFVVPPDPSDTSTAQSRSEEEREENSERAEIFESGIMPGITTANLFREF